MIKTRKDRCQDTYQPPLRLVAGRLIPFLGDGDARREGKPPGLVVLSVAAREPG